MIRIEAFVEDWAASPFAVLAEPAWRITARLEILLRDLIDGLGGEYRRTVGIAVHDGAVVEAGAVLKPPVIVGPGCLVAAGAYLRGGVFLGARCVVGPGSELKSSIAFPGTALAHFNFVGDSILGRGVNLEAGAVIANHRNERADKAIHLHVDGAVVETGADKFGALVGDRARIGANAVVAPGAVLRPGTCVPRLALIDQDGNRPPA